MNRTDWSRQAARILVACLAAVTLNGGCASSAGSDPALAGPRETVVLLHGLGRSAMAMWRLADQLEAAGSLGVSPAEILVEVTEQVAACCRQGTQPLHFVGHSLGGLMIRAYLAQQRPATLGRVVLLGTPNQGTPIVDHYRERWWFRLIGEAGLSLGTGPEAFPNRLPPPDYPVGVIAGEDTDVDNEDILPGRDDGLVPVASTRLDGMTDFIVLPTSHWGMRYDGAVADQTIAFLRTGSFSREVGSRTPTSPDSAR